MLTDVKKIDEGNSRMESKPQNSQTTSDTVKETVSENDQEDPSDTEFEFEFLPSVSSIKRERSASPDPAEAVLDQLYEAAQKGDSSELVNLMFSDLKSDASDVGPNGDNDDDNEEAKENNTDVNQNYAIMNMLKRKAHPDNGKNVETEINKRLKLSNDTVEGFNIRNLGNLGIGNLSLPFTAPSLIDKDRSYFENPKRKKNPNRTPTPPSMSPPRVRKIRNIEELEKAQSLDKTLNTQVVESSTSNGVMNTTSYVVPIVQKYRSLLTGAIKNAAERSRRLAGNMNSTVAPDNNFTETTNEEPSQPVEKNLIDYTVLTKALSKTLESKLREDKGNDVKIVIFCNNKPIQSFSVRSNKQFLSSPESTSSSSVKGELESAVKVNDIGSYADANNRVLHAANVTFINKANSHLVPAKTIPTVGDVRAILERNKMIANESLAKFQFGRPKMKKICDKVHLQEIQNAAFTRATSLLSSDSDELSEGNLVINDSVNTDENRNINDSDIVCEICGKEFKQRRYLNRHKVRIHSKLGETSDVKNDGNKSTEDETLIDKIPDTLSELSNGLEKENSETIVKSVPASELDDPDMNTILNNENVLNMLESADKGKRSILIKSEGVDGMKAYDILSDTLDRTKSFVNYNAPIGANGLIEPVYVCEQCGKFYRARKTLKDHFLREHAKDKDDEPLYLYISGNKYQCPLCFKNFHSGSELVSHTKKHTGESRSVCCLCGKVYSSVHGLRRHMENVHADMKPRPFRCELCDYAASNKWHLKEHYRRHTGKLSHI